MERDIQIFLGPLATQNIIVGGHNVRHDIETLVRRVLMTDAKLRRRPPALKEEIERVLVQNSNGMFRWAACQLDTLRTCLTPSAVRKTLQSLPKDLEETYDRILCRITEKSHPLALTASQFLTFSAGPGPSPRAGRDDCYQAGDEHIYRHRPAL
ncbi:hypothetical protein ASPZODRAFT_1172467 [Penicilliopsis zonata CBS 506.65]|uniref:Uncharacterized protein n=1 Tax=Penicilliopsis zonata CBS 506.65 TaxID=1073090 RepID=A0A1L9S7S1_9EURO|nr:hypothetical protein ASPZODRAFT_1172467 [Penicilliopsis zonata CBS 506.65]OJJ43205.1 hypothetical protein ASPZODRAFT_1172467 [Penicilliopsis zonata CBS 506.65]